MRIRLTVLAALLLTLWAFLPTLASAQVRTCFCCSPWPSKGAATGRKANTRNKQSTVKISFYKPGTGKVTAMNQPAAGDTCEDIMNDLKAQVEAAGCTAGDVTVNPDTGRAVFCVDGRMSSATARENDTGIREVTHRIVGRPTDPFLRGVAEAFEVAAIGEGGSVTLEVFAAINDDEEDVVVTLELATFPGQPGTEVNEQLVAGLNDAGFEAWLGTFQFDDDEEPVDAILINPGTFYSITGVGLTGEDEGFNQTGVASFIPGVVIIDADANGDGVVTTQDFQQFLALVNEGDPRADLNHDGLVGDDDLVTFFNISRSLVQIVPPKDVLQTQPLQLDR
jgi:hypothetical protein